MSELNTQIRRGTAMCTICRREAPTHRNDAFQWVVSRHDWFMTEERCPGSLRLIPAVTP